MSDDAFNTRGISSVRDVYMYLFDSAMVSGRHRPPFVHVLVKMKTI